MKFDVVFHKGRHKEIAKVIAGLKPQNRLLATLGNGGGQRPAGGKKGGKKGKAGARGNASWTKRDGGAASPEKG